MQLHYKCVGCLFIEAPAIPGGPLIVSQVLKHSMTITWQPPHSDGGSTIKGYIIEIKDAHTGTGELIYIILIKKVNIFPKNSVLIEYEYEND